MNLFYLLSIFNDFQTNLYIRGLSAETTDTQLREMCEPFGKIVSTKAIIDKTTNQCKGYGFVDFDTAEAAQAAVISLSEKNIQAQMAKVWSKLFVSCCWSFSRVSYIKKRVWRG